MAAGTETGQLGEKRLGTIHAVAQSLAIGPMFSTAIVLSLVASTATGAGFNAALSVLIAGLGVLAIGYSLALFARRYAGAGAVYEYLTHGAHPIVGIFTAGVFFLGTLFLGGGGIYVGIGVLGNGFWAAHISDNGTGPRWWIFALIALVIVLILNYLGVRLAIRAMLTFAAISVVPMLFLAIAIIVQGGAEGNTLSVFNPSTTSVSTAFNGVLIGILLFVGFEAAASIGEESHDPHNSIPRAVLGTIGVSAIFFVIMTYAISIGYGQTAIEADNAWAIDPTALDTMATKYVGDWLATIIDLVVILDAMGLALAICVTIGRGYFALGRDGLLPSFFARTSRHNTPWVGNLMVVIGCLGLIYISELTSRMDKFVPIFGSNGFATFVVSATAGSYAIELVYLIMAAVALKLVWDMNGTPGQWWRYPVIIVAILTPILGFKGALWPEPHDASLNPNWEAMYWALAVVVIAFVWTVALALTRSEKVRNAASHASTHQGVAALDQNLDFTPAPEDTTI